MPTAHPTELDLELRFFNAHRSELLQQAEGKFALIKGDTLLGTFENEAIAIRRGYQVLGNVPFLVKKITQVDIPQNFSSFNLGL